jgi:photosystem II stability/assembly factor-like uncharacterized protein
MSPAHDYWRLLGRPVTHTLRKLQFVDSLTGWAAGDSGVIIHTTDGGHHWTRQNSSVHSDIVDIFFLDRRHGWALAWLVESPPFGTAVLSTTNGGTTWERKTFAEENVFLGAVHFLDSLTGWMAGHPATIVSTTNGGTDWIGATTVGFCSGYPVLDFNFYDNRYAFANGGAYDISGVAWRTTDYGRRWEAECIAPEPVHRLHFIDSLNIIGVGGDFEYGCSITRTTDGGENWDFVNLQVFGIASGLSFRTPAEAWAPLGTAERFIFTLDSGRTWSDVATPARAVVFDLVFTDSLYGFAVGDSGVVLEYVPLPVGVSERKPYAAPEFTLLTNYPNPFNPSTRISFTLPMRGAVSLTVFDLTCREVVRLLDGEQAAGEHSVEFDGSGLSSGVYTCRLQVGSYNALRKLLLVR